MKRETEKFDFSEFGRAIKAARKAKGISRNQLADKLHIAPRYIASIELVTFLEVSVDAFFFPDQQPGKSTQRRQLDSLLDTMNSRELTIMAATARGIWEARDTEKTN